MATPDTLNKVTNIYREGEVTNRCTDFAKVANQIQQQTGFLDPAEIVYQARRISRPDHLFPNALAITQKLLSRGDHVTIWTQGHPLNQLYKIAGSGIGRVRRELSNSDRRRFSVTAEMDKVTEIDKPIMGLRTKGVEKVVIVDDKSDNVKKVKARVEELKQAGRIDPEFDVSVLWARYGVYKNEAPKGMTLDDFLKEVETIEDISDLKRYEASKGKTGWMLDFDNTLFRTADYNKELYAQAAHIVDGIDHILPAQVGVAADVSGKIKSIDLMKHGGMSGSNIIIVDTGDRQIVIKHNHDKPDRVQDDIEGYRFLADTPLGEKMPPLTKYDEKKGFLVLPHINGRTLRELLVTGEIDSHTAVGLYSDLLDRKIQWWGSQAKQPYEGQAYKSMQRTEWDETLKLIPEALERMAQHFGIHETAFQNMPLRIGGRKLPSLETMITAVDQLLQKHPDYLIGVHGDATGSNIIYNHHNNTYTIIDAEWSGWGDPAESLVRMAKHRSSTTVSGIQVDGVGIYEGGIGVRMKGAFSPGADALQNYVGSRAQEFAQVLKDPDLLRRMKVYETGSYLREVALSQKRGSAESALLAMMMAGQSLAGPILAHHAAA